MALEPFTLSTILDDFDFTRTSAKKVARGKDWVLLLGDSARIIRELGEYGQRVDALITDPPYSSGGQFRGDRNKGTGEKYRQSSVKTELVLNDFEGDNRDQRSFLAWATLWLWDAKQIVTPGGLGFIFSDWRQVPISTDAFQAGGWIWRGLFAWDKLGGERPGGYGRFSARNEFGIWGSNGPMRLVQKTKDAVALGFDGPMLAGTFGASAPRDRFHVTQKPVNLLRYLAGAVPRSATIFDPFAGSASTGAGALMRGRRFVGVELDARAFEKSAARLEVVASKGPDLETLAGDAKRAAYDELDALFDEDEGTDSEESAASPNA